MGYEPDEWGNWMRPVPASNNSQGYFIIAKKNKIVKGFFPQVLKYYLFF